MPFPALSDDPLEQLLIHEAVMTRYHSEIADAQDHEHRRTAAREQAAATLAAAKGGR